MLHDHTGGSARISQPPTPNRIVIGDKVTLREYRPPSARWESDRFPDGARLHVLLSPLSYIKPDVEALKNYDQRQIHAKPRSSFGCFAEQATEQRVVLLLQCVIAFASFSLETFDIQKDDPAAPKMRGQDASRAEALLATFRENFQCECGRIAADELTEVPGREAA